MCYLSNIITIRRDLGPITSTHWLFSKKSVLNPQIIPNNNRASNDIGCYKLAEGLVE